MFVTKEQLKLFIDGVYAKHTTGNHDVMSIG